MLKTEFIPAAERDSRRLLVVLHGLGDSSAGYRWLPEMMALPWLNALLVNAPDSYFGGFSWYDFPGEAGPGVERSSRLIFDLLDEQRALGFPTEETVLFGFSQGCLMTIEAGLRYPHRLAGLVGISGYVHDLNRLLAELSPTARAQRLLLTHGSFDPLIPVDPVRAQMEQLKAAGLNIKWHELAKAHTIAGEFELGLIRRFIEETRRPGKAQAA